MLATHSASTSGRADGTNSRAYAEARLCSRWPARDDQIRALLDYVWDAQAAMPPLLVYGGPSTGKTAIIRDVFRELGRPYCYISCVEFDKPRQLLQAILDRLRGKKRKSADGYVGEARSEQVADFLVQLQGLPAGGGNARYIVLDRVERLAGSDVLAALLRARELAGGAAGLGLLLISRLAWGLNVFEADTLRGRRPHQLCFPGYRMQELLTILELLMPEGADARLFRLFLSTFIGPMFARCSSRIEDLQMVIEQLWPEYVRPVAEGRLQAGARQALFAAFRDKALAAKACFEAGLHNQIALAEALAARPGGAAGTPSDRLDFELPFSAKFLLLAAYVASRNKPALDRRLFDPNARSGRRRGAMASDKQAEAAAEARLRGPHAFPLERLLGVFWELRAAQGEGPPARVAERADLQSADVLMQISSLVALRFLSQVNDRLDERKFTCSVSDELAERIARNVKVSLRDYVFYV